MKEIMGWNVCLDKHIRKIEPDLERIESMKEMAIARFRNAEKMDSVSLVVEAYYESIKELLVAFLLKNGMRSDNHQCLISYFLKENSNLENEVNLISRMSFYRNRLNYYGEKIPSSFYDDNKKEIKRIFSLIKEIL